MNSTLVPILIMLDVLVFYANTGIALILASIAIRTRHGSAITATILSLVLPAVSYYRGAHSGLIGFSIAGLISSLIVYPLYRWWIVANMDWQTMKFRNEAARQTILHLVLITGSLVFLVPFAWLVSTSLKEDKEMSAFPPVWIPTQQITININGKDAGKAVTTYQAKKVTVAVLEEYDTGQRKVRILEPADLQGTEFETSKDNLTEIRHIAPVWKNYWDALKFLPPETNRGLSFLLNTLQVTVLSIAGTLLASSMVAYGFARLRWPGRDALFVVLLGTMMLPSAVTMMPVFMIFRAVGWVDTLKPLWVPAFFGAPYYIFLLRQFFLSIPTELEDAAKIDGCSYYTIFWRIMLPQIKPALAALTIMAFMASWNDFLGPLIYISSPERETLAYALQLFQTAHGGEPALLMAASTMMIVPVVVLFFFTQRYFIQGITLTGIKG